MKERIIIMPGSGSELLRTMARMGKNALGVRIMNASQLARLSLTCSSIPLEKRMISENEGAALIHSFLSEIEYFRPVSYSDSKNLMNSINQMRMMIADDESSSVHSALAGGEFPDKNRAVAEAYDRYCNILEKEGVTDSAGIMRHAVSSGAKLDMDRYQVTFLKEFPPAPFERTFAESVTRGQAEETDLIELMGLEPSSTAIDGYAQAYGLINEIKYILAHIIENGIPYDKCTIAAADPARYAGTFHDLAGEYGIDMTFGCGLPAELSKPAALFRLYRRWNEEGWKGVNALENMVFDDCFRTGELCEMAGCDAGELRQAVKIAGELRIGSDRSVNDERLQNYPHRDEPLLRVVKTIAQALQMPLAVFVRTFSDMDDNSPFDKAALEAMCSSAEMYEKITGENSAEIIDDILKQTVYRQGSREGAIHVSSIGEALTSLRENLYICGLDSSVFPGSPRENHILLDSDLKLFCEEAVTSAGVIERNKEQLRNLVSLASSAGSRIRISFSSYDLASLKELNPSSAVYEIFRSHRGSDRTAEDFKKECVSTGYFDKCFSGADVTAGRHVDGIRAEYNVPQSLVRLEEKKGFSPSAIGEFFQCGVRFMLNRMAGIYLEEPDDPLRVISAADMGTLAHLVMENAAEGKGNTSEQVFDDFMKQRPPVNRQGAANARIEFLDMMKRALRDDPGNQVVMAEDQLSAQCCGVNIYGRPDRIEKTADGKYIVVDFKTGRRVTHEENDPDTCLQIILYAYMAEACGCEIERGEFRYLRNSRVVPCIYDDEMKKQLRERMEFFRESIEKGEYRYTDYPDACRYCLYGHLCGKEDM